MARGHRLNTSIVLAAVHGLSGLFRAVSAVEPSLFRPLPPLSPSLINRLASVDVKQNGPGPKNRLQICKTRLDDAGRIPLQAGGICLQVHGNLRCQLILEHRRENSHCRHVGPVLPPPPHFFLCVESHTLCLVVSPLVVFGKVYTDSKLWDWLMVEVLLYVHRNRRFISDGSPGRPLRLSHSGF